MCIRDRQYSVSRLTRMRVRTPLIQAKAGEGSGNDLGEHGSPTILLERAGLWLPPQRLWGSTGCTHGVAIIVVKMGPKKPRTDNPGSNDEWTWERAAIYGAIARHTIAISTHEGAETSSGVCVSYGGEHFVATASHVVEHCAPNDLSFMARSGPLRLINKNEVDAYLRHAKLSTRFHPPIDRIIRSSPIEDIALLRLSEIPAEMRAVQFHHLEGYRARYKVKDGVFVVGFAKALTRVVQVGSKVGGAVFLHIEPTDVRSIKLTTDDYDSKFHFLVDFPRPMASEESVSHPRGLSGTGVWKIERMPGKNEIWAPILRLVGIQSAWVEKKQVLIVTRTSRLVRLLQSQTLVTDGIGVRAF